MPLFAPEKFKILGTSAVLVTAPVNDTNENILDESL